MSNLNLNARRWHPNAKWGLAYGFLGVLIAFGIRFGLQPVLETNLPLFFFQINTLIITFFFGIIPALFTVLLSLPVIAYFFLEPLYAFDVVDARDIRLVLIYVTYTLITGFIIEWLRRVQYSHRLEILVGETKSKLLIEKYKNKN
jgi:K+-sensing histidine kinase KdpD